ncbi:MAG: NAD(+) synthase, partial [Spirochaetes bacterium GWF1_41_5]
IIKYTQNKILLPEYDVFEERRHYLPGNENSLKVIDFKGLKIGFTICEDAWVDEEITGPRGYETDAVSVLCNKGADLIINIAASPYSRNKISLRQRLFQKLSQKHNIVFIYVNQAGANDDLIFDGSSAVYKNGRLLLQAESFKEDLLFYDTEKTYNFTASSGQNRMHEVRSALVLGIRDYAGKTGFTRAAVGVSGGIDSAVVLTLAAEALGPENILALAMPSEYSSPESLSDAQELCRNLSVKCTELPIHSVFTGIKSSLAGIFSGLSEDITEENIQARIRGLFLMAVSNKFRALLLTTGNKSEIGVGYCTLYGDTCGALAVIADLYKTEVYELAALLNRGSAVIPQNIICRAPSAELRTGQKDQDTLPPYDLLDRIIKKYYEEYKSPQQIIAETGCSENLVIDIIKKLDQAEYKRYQLAPGLRISEKAFGSGRKFPVVKKLSYRSINV